MYATEPPVVSSRPIASGTTDAVHPPPAVSYDAVAPTCHNDYVCWVLLTVCSDNPKQFRVSPDKRLESAALRIENKLDSLTLRKVQSVSASLQSASHSSTHLVRSSEPSGSLKKAIRVTSAKTRELGELLDPIAPWLCGVERLQPLQLGVVILISNESCTLTRTYCSCRDPSFSMASRLSIWY